MNACVVEAVHKIYYFSFFDAAAIQIYWGSVFQAFPKGISNYANQVQLVYVIFYNSLLKPETFHTNNAHNVSCKILSLNELYNLIFP